MYAKDMDEEAADEYLEEKLLEGAKAAEAAAKK
jgi:hypothetical protein